MTISKNFLQRLGRVARGSYSNIITVPPLPPPDTTLPIAGVLTPTSDSESQITIAHSGASDNVGIDHIILQYSLDGVFFWTTIDANATFPYVHAELDPATVYYYRAIVYDAAGNSSVTLVANARTDDILIISEDFSGTLSAWDEQNGAVAIVGGELQMTLTAGTQNNNWIVKYFGDSNDVAGGPGASVNKLFARCVRRYSPDSTIFSSVEPPVTTIKIMQINWDDPNDFDGSKRRHQVQLMVQYLAGQHKLVCEIAQFDSAGNFTSGVLVPEVAGPALVDFDTDMYLKMQVFNNHPAFSNGTIRVWKNDVLILQDASAQIQTDGSSPNKLIISSYDGRGNSTGNGFAYTDSILVQTNDVGSWAPPVTAQRFETLSSALYSNDHNETTIPPVQSPPGSGGVYTSPDGVEFNIDEHALFSAGLGYSDANILETKGIVTQIVDKVTPDGTALNGTIGYPDFSAVGVNLPNQFCFGMLIKVTADYFSWFIDTFGIVRCKQFEVNTVTFAPTGGRPELYWHAVEDTRAEVTNTVQLPGGARVYFVPVIAQDANGTGRQDEFGQPHPQISYDASNVHTFNLLDYVGEWIFCGGRYQWDTYGDGQIRHYVATQSIGAAASAKFTVAEASPLLSNTSITTSATHGNFASVSLNEWIVDTVGASATSIMENDCVAIDTDFTTMLTGYPSWVTTP